MSESPNEPNPPPPNPEPVVFQYLSPQAEEDGVLVNIEKINTEWEKGPINYVTTNLLVQGGYLDASRKLNLNCLLDLLNQSLSILKTKSKDFTEMDWFFSGSIELPNGSKQDVFIEENETGKFTVMLPEDH